MLNWLANFQIEKISFFIGFVAALIFVLAINRIIKLLPDLKKFLMGYLYNYKKIRLTNVREAILNEAFSRAQTNHLTKNLFSLDEILIEPSFLVQPDINLDDNFLFKSEIPSVVPFIPEYPILSRNFNVPRIKISEITQTNANIVVCGLPGSGKTVALSHLVSQLIQNNNKELSKNITPIFLSVHDIGLNSTQSPISDLIIKPLMAKIHGISFKQLQNYINNEIDSHNCILILDGLDELHPEDYDKFTDFLKNIFHESPTLQIITTSTPFYFGDLLKIGFIPIFISEWSTTQTQNFYEKWHSLWNNYVEKSASTAISTPNTLIKAWTSARLHPMSPLEYTLYMWGASSGDSSGFEVSSLLNSYIDRLIPEKEHQKKLTTSAIECLKKRTPIIGSDQKLDEFEYFTELGLILKAKNGKFAFRNSTIMAFLAFKQNEENHLILADNDLSWAAIIAYFGYLSGETEKLIDPTKVANNIDSLLISIYRTGYLLKISKPDSQFRTILIKKLINHIYDKKIVFSIRLMALAALLQSNDPNIPSFVKQLLSNNEQDFIQIALFAIGSMNKNSSFIKEIIPITKNPSLNLRKLAYLVLTTFDEEIAINELGKALLSEDEKIRQLIAESFSFNNPKGEEILKEAISLEDIVVRRSAIFGLIKLNNNWARKTLKTLAVEDNQWVIRNAALQATEFLERETLLLPKSTYPLHQNPWLIKFAGEHNLGVSPGKPTAGILLMALSSESSKDVVNATRLMIQDYNEKILESLIEKLESIKDQQIIDQILLTLFLIGNSKNSNNSNSEI